MDEALSFGPFDAMPEPRARRAVALGQARSFRAGKALWYQGDIADGCCLLLSGRARASTFRADETTVDAGVFGPGAWLGLAEQVLSGPRMNDVIADRAVDALWFPRPAFERLLEESGVTAFFLRELARAQYSLNSRVELARPFDRIARFLAEECGRAPGGVARTQEEIAEAAGVARETANRNLARMQELGWIRLGRGRVEVLRPESLDPGR